MKKPWRVRFHQSGLDYEEIFDFETEAKARKLYDRVIRRKNLAYSMIFNRLEAAASGMSAIALAAIVGKPKLKKIWVKLTVKEKAKFEEFLKKRAIELLKEALG